METKVYDNTARMSQGMAYCAGCGIPIVFNPVLQAVHDMGYVPITHIASGCGVVGAHIFPNAGLKDSHVHIIFETAGAGGSAMRDSIEIAKDLGEIPEHHYFPVVFAGDGATADIGIGSLSGMLARGDKVLYVCYDNAHYANTGCQYSSTTPAGAHTTTTPLGFMPTDNYQGKDMIKVVLAHPAIQYIGHTTITSIFPKDLENHPEMNDIRAKARDAVACGGPSYMHVIQPCNRGWGFSPEYTVEVGNIGVRTGVIPIFHIVREGDWFVHQHKWFLDYLPARYEGGVVHPEINPISEWFDAQNRFKASRRDKDWVANMQRAVDWKWTGEDGLLKKCQLPRA
jgi:pyruvate ferredoxin oxidoreductase beta subunit